MVEWLNPQPGWTVLDVAGGTGDIAFRIAEMAARARRRSRDHGLRHQCRHAGRGRAPRRRKRRDGDRLGLRRCRAAAVAGCHFDAYTIAFGIRNVTHIDRALREARRVLKPGGRFLCLEFSRVEVPGLDALYDAYSFKLMPRIGGLVARDEESYRYLAESIRRFPPQAEFAADDRGGRPGAGEGAQPDRRHRRHAFGLADLMGAFVQLLRRLLHAARCCRRRRWRFRDAPPADAGRASGRARWKVWVRPISSWARCWRPGPTSSARRWRRALEHLQDRLPPFPEAEARARRSRGFRPAGRRPVSRFGEPVAAASIAQVHRADDQRTARTVAVKVLRPGIEARIRPRSAALRFRPHGRAFSAEARRLRLTRWCETLAASVALELDLRMEAAAASELAERTRGDDDFRVPHIDWSAHLQPRADQRMDRRHADARSRGARGGRPRSQAHGADCWCGVS